MVDNAPNDGPTYSGRINSLLQTISELNEFRKKNKIWPVNSMVRILVQAESLHVFLLLGTN